MNHVMDTRFELQCKVFAELMKLFLLYYVMTAGFVPGPYKATWSEKIK